MPERQVLVRAVVRRTRTGIPQESTRYVPVGEFGLWQYAMSNRHGLEVTAASIGVWLPDREFERHPEIFRGTGGVQQVDRVDVSLFDDQLGICHLVRRFAAREDLPALNHRLAQHLGPGDYRPEVTEGVFAGARAVTDLRRLSRPMAAIADDMPRVVHAHH